MTHNIPSILAAMISLGLLLYLAYRIRRENREQAERDAYVERVYRECSFDEKFDAIRRNRSERSEDWL